jgi:WS/DGAT/MGAT family acyltransferase
MTTWDRLSAEDRLFLDVEDPLNNMHIAGCFVFEAGPLGREGIGVDIERIRDYIESRLYRIPRYRQRLETVPYEGHPIWVDDENFNILYHVRHTRLPLPGGERQLKRLCGRIISQQLDRHKPLWEMWVVEGLEGDRFALVSKVHHCMADGISGVDLLRSLLRATPEKTFDAGPSWFPQPMPSSGELVRDAVIRRARVPLDIASSLVNAVREPSAAIDRARDTLSGLVEMLEVSSHTASETPLDRRVGPYRRYDWQRFDLDEVNAVRRVFGGTLNDVVLATVAGALGRFFELRGITPAEQRALDFRVACPVNTRANSDKGTFGNQVSIVAVQIPLGESDPIETLERVREAMDAVKESRQSEALQTIAQFADWVSPSLLGGLARYNFERHAANLVVTNVPGPKSRLYMLGAQMLESYPVVPLMPGNALGVALFSYNGVLHWGITADWDLVPDLHEFGEALGAAFAALREAAEKA